MKPTAIRLERRTHDGSLTAYWEATVLRQRSKYLIWHAPPRTPVVYPQRGFTSALRQHLLGWLWLDRYYTVEIELNPAGQLERAVGGICLPPTLQGEVVSLVELGLTVLITPGPQVVIDDDEFQEAVNDYGYDHQLRTTAWQAVEELHTLLRNGEGPFGPDLAKMHGLALKQTRASTPNL